MIKRKEPFSRVSLMLMLRCELALLCTWALLRASWACWRMWKWSGLTACGNSGNKTPTDLFSSNDRATLLLFQKQLGSGCCAVLLAKTSSGGKHVGWGGSTACTKRKASSMDWFTHLASQADCTSVVKPRRWDGAWLDVCEGGCQKSYYEYVVKAVVIVARR